MDSLYTLLDLMYIHAHRHTAMSAEQSLVSLAKLAHEVSHLLRGAVLVSVRARLYVLVH